MATAVRTRQDSDQDVDTEQAGEGIQSKAPPTVAKTLLTSVSIGFVLVSLVSGLLFALIGSGSALHSLVFGLFVGFWIGLGGGLIAGGAVMSYHDEQAHS